MRPEPIAILALLLAGCASKAAPVESAATTARVPAQRAQIARVREVRRAPPPAATVLALPGLESVIGASASDLVRQFGSPRLDVVEGDARKLQFVGNACLLDVFLYPSATGREPQATYVDARRASDGKDVDRVGCINALRASPTAGAGSVPPR